MVKGCVSLPTCVGLYDSSILRLMRSEIFERVFFIAYLWIRVQSPFYYSRKQNKIIKF